MRKAHTSSYVQTAISPTAQVHAATLAGDPVAVKVARPGVAETVRSELALLDILAAPMIMVFPRADVRSLMVMEHLAVGNALQSEDGKEGVQAFLQKREPKWVGR